MTLLELQRRMAEDVRRPLTSDYEMQKTTENGGSTEEIATSYIAPNPRLSSFERLEIYNRQYWFRLISAVSEDFPTLNALLGPKRFDAPGIPRCASQVHWKASPSRCRCCEARVGVCRSL